jgi:hypothetical protein
MKQIAFLSLVLCTLLMLSCRSGRELSTQNTTHTERTLTVIEHDTVFTISPDTSTFKARLLVSPSGELSLSEITRSKGSYIEAPQVHIRGNVLQVDCYAKAQHLFHSWKESYLKEHSQSVKTIRLPPQKIEKRLSIWQHVQIWLGRLLLIILAIGLTALYLHHQSTKSPHQ